MHRGGARSRFMRRVAGYSGRSSPEIDRRADACYGFEFALDVFENGWRTLPELLGLVENDDRGWVCLCGANECIVTGRFNFGQSQFPQGRLAPLFAKTAGFPLLRELLELARELVKGIIEGENDLRRTRNVVAVEESAVAVQVCEDGLGNLERALLRLDERRLERVDVVTAPKALVPHDRNLAIDAIDRIEVVFNADLFEDIRVARVEAALLLDLAELPAAGAIEGVPVIEEEDALSVILAIRVLAISNAAFHAGHFTGGAP